MDEILQKILAITQGNRNHFLEYIVERVQRDDYRGIQISQHNRYTLDDVVVILGVLYDVAKGGFLSVPLGDLTSASDQGQAKEDHPEYAEVVEKICDQMGRTTMNSLKKNFFVDLDRAGFIDRFGETKELLDSNNRSHVHFVKLTKDAINLIKAQKLTDKHYIFSRKIDTLFGDTISELAEIIYHSEYSNDSISYTEFQYILSDTKKSGEEKISLLNSYRDLSELQKKKVHELLKEYCDPDRFDGSKTVKRDYHNWRNETQQIMYLLKNTIYFDVREQNFSLNRGTFGIFPDTRRPMRQLGAKQEYFSKHEITKREGFDLHHIIPIKFARNRPEFIIIDSYRNLIYIEREKHREIKDSHLLLKINDGLVVFQDIYCKLTNVEATNHLSAMYKDDLSEEMMDYNAAILKERFDFPHNEGAYT